MARERKGDGGEKRGERERSEREDDLRGKTKAEKERRALREGARPVNECQTGFIKCTAGMLCLSMSVYHYVNTNSQ